MKKPLIVATSRIVKLLANITKVLSYPFHWVLPNQRFTLPAHAEPLLKGGTPSRIPRIIWQTNFTDRVTLPVYLNYLFNRLMAPRFEYRFMINEARHAFIAEHYPDILPHYERLQIGAAQADLWRLLVLQRIGGVYLDIDAHQVWPLASVLGTERNELYVTTRKGELSNYFIASAPNNPNLAAVIDQIIVNITGDIATGVFDTTGPGVFNQVLNRVHIPTVSYRHAVHQGSFTNEYFQYIDKREGKWTKQQHQVAVVAKAPASSGEQPPRQG
ncbi:glycosyltransferase [uncultured Halomonas sp.]|uniref:glycosyltransferase family 32 protein n=1 Tax=uncultured Halomonas sp. TaxID=173971 RepID=UPI0026103DB1|nr:glycosyltransferase [uncultured Halomonas sp.]